MLTANLADPPALGLLLIGDEYLLGTLRLRQHRSLFTRIACHLTTERYQRGAHLVKALDPHLDVDQLFYHRERMWYELLRLGYSLQDLRAVITYLQREIRAQHRNVGALKLSVSC